jgi:hypothetical protein
MKFSVRWNTVNVWITKCNLISGNKPSPMGMGGMGGGGPGKFNTVASRPTSGSHGAIPFGRGSVDDCKFKNYAYTIFFLLTHFSKYVLYRNFHNHCSFSHFI